MAVCNPNRKYNFSKYLIMRVGKHRLGLTQRHPANPKKDKSRFSRGHLHHSCHNHAPCELGPQPALQRGSCTNLSRPSCQPACLIMLTHLSSKTFKAMAVSPKYPHVNK
eukprot:3651945-Amphidinium_carterae.1